VGLAILNQELEKFLHLVAGQAAEPLTLVERKLKYGTAQMLEQDEQVVGVDQSLLRRAAEEVFGMVGKELVDRVGRGDQHGCSGCEAAPGAPRLLPGG